MVFTQCAENDLNTNCYIWMKKNFGQFLMLNPYQIAFFVNLVKNKRKTRILRILDKINIKIC
jgi:hypothetical protein